MFLKPDWLMLLFLSVIILATINYAEELTTVELIFLTNPLNLNKTIEVNSPDAVKKMLAAGCQGVALSPRADVEKELSEGSLKGLKWKGPAFNTRLYMILNNEKHRTEATKVFVELVRQYFAVLSRP